jgi:hypothetical protein
MIDLVKANSAYRKFKPSFVPSSRAFESSALLVAPASKAKPVPHKDPKPISHMKAKPPVIADMDRAETSLGDVSMSSDLGMASYCLPRSHLLI